MLRERRSGNAKKPRVRPGAPSIVSTRSAEGAVRCVVLFVALVLSGVEPPSLWAQAPDTTERAPLFEARDAYFLAGFAAGTIAAFPLDERLADGLQDSTTQANRLFQRAATGFNLTARPGSFIIGGSLYAVGRLAGSRRMADLGLHGTEALLLNEAITRLVKGLAGRGRPLLNREDARDFELGRGFGSRNYASFPSGHTSSAFAAAAAVTAEAGAWWPRWKPLIGTVMFGGASLAGLSRMYNNKHWASDVVTGAALGSFVGWKLVRYHHTRPNNRIDRLLLAMTVVPTARGEIALVWVAPLGARIEQRAILDRPVRAGVRSPAADDVPGPHLAH